MKNEVLRIPSAVLSWLEFRSKEFRSKVLSHLNVLEVDLQVSYSRLSVFGTVVAL